MRLVVRVHVRHQHPHVRLEARDNGSVVVKLHRERVALVVRPGQVEAGPAQEVVLGAYISKLVG